ncbi:hypothetical protein HMPREF3293_01587 [Christensenella minuta]|uniref:Uncharacterized protein n=1 Tax=Christensenella minuta TaxID=626937 RepID=A0A136Q3W7_9FIRM|nr:hypothetical protein HMPREF3293_01587 [Christensenella minuta]
MTKTTAGCYSTHRNKMRYASQCFLNDNYRKQACGPERSGLFFCLLPQPGHAP